MTSSNDVSIPCIETQLELYRPRNDPDPEMIPSPEMIPKSTPKWSRPRNDPQGIREWKLNMGLWIAL